MKTLTVRNIQQKVLIQHEILGQLSEGLWENAKPHGHFKVWYEATVVIDPVRVGRNFYASKDNYNLSALLKFDGAKRMVSYVALALQFGEENVGLLGDLLDLSGDFSGIPDYPDKYYDELSKFDLESIKKYLETQKVYGIKQLRADLRELKTIFKTYVNN